MRDTKEMQADIINGLQDFLDGLRDRWEIPTDQEPATPTPVRASVPMKEEPPAKEDPSKASVQPTLEEVRKVLADAAAAGHREEVKQLLGKHGATQLSAIDSKQYADLMKEASDLAK